MTDEKMILKIKNQDFSGMNHLINKYTNYFHTIIFNTAKGYLTKEDIEELVSDCFIKIWSISKEIQIKKDDLKSYFAVMARNMTKNKLKTKKIVYLPLNEDCISLNVDIENNFEIKEIKKEVNDIIFNFKKTDKQIFILRYFYFKKIHEIGALLNINNKTVETKLLRGREKIKKLLEKRGYL